MAVLQIEGERRVLAANGSNGTLATCAIRPSGIFGEGDVTFFPTLVAKARQGKLKYYIGNGRNRVEFTYVGNVAQAHIEVMSCACEETAVHYEGEPAGLMCTAQVQPWCIRYDVQMSLFVGMWCIMSHAWVCKAGHSLVLAVNVAVGSCSIVGV